MKSFVVAALLSIISFNTFSQDNVITWSANKPLQWNYFIGKADDKSHFDAESYCEISYTYNFITLDDFSFDVKATFHGSTSWIKNHVRTAELLQHEQLHFDIAELYARKLKVAFESFTYSNNFKSEIAQIFALYEEEYHQMQNRYDKDTNHSIDGGKQKQWERFVTLQLHKTEGRSKVDEKYYASSK